MKGERIIAELLSILGMLIYGVLLQHLYAELMEKPERSWLNQGKAWWLTRHSQAKVLQLQKVWNKPEASLEPEV